MGLRVSYDNSIPKILLFEQGLFSVVIAISGVTVGFSRILRLPLVSELTPVSVFVQVLNSLWEALLRLVWVILRD